MQRKTPFLTGETYHIYTRGVEKRIICETDGDYRRLQLLLYLCNDDKAVQVRNVLSRYRGLPLVKVFEQEKRSDTLVEILSYALMPNHFHLLLREKVLAGISHFMHKLMTAYSMYFNTKNERSGPLFTRPFRSKHIDSDPYLLWVFAYITLNPLALHQSDWELGIRDIRAAGYFLQRYPYSSFADNVASRPVSRILSLNDPSYQSLSTNAGMDTLLEQLSKYQGESFEG